MLPPKVIWLFGLSGAGKSTISKRLVEDIKRRNQNVILLDGDIIRKGISKDLGFSRKDRKENVRRIAEICKILLQTEVIPIVAAITPYESDRLMVQHILGNKNIALVHIYCSLEVCEKRDPKGLYKKVRSGEISNFTGITDPFNPPELNHVKIETHKNSIETCSEKILEYLKLY